jgi:hypothetical protein
MIQLKADCLIFKTAGGENVPCSAEMVTVELMGEAAGLLDPELIRHASTAVLHYFKHELGRTCVSVAEFSAALETVLRGLGLKVESSEPDGQVRVCDSDLRLLACASGKGFELSFFSTLRDEIRDQLKDRPHVLRFNGLRGCVKQLVGAQRWTGRCQSLNDHIVEYLRQCLSAENKTNCCGLVIV